MELEYPHILLLPLPFQGHIMPLMEMGYHLIDSGFTITFVINESTHQRLLAATSDEGLNGFSSASNRFHLVGISDGLRCDEERNDIGLFCKLVPPGMSPGIESILRDAAAQGRPIQWIIADQSMAWAFPLAKRMGLRVAVFWAISAAMLAYLLNVPKLIETRMDVNIEEGLEKDEIFKLAVGMPAIHSSHLPWNMAKSSAEKSIFFSFILSNNRSTTEHAEFIICNTFMDLEPEAISLLPTLVPIGPLIPAEHHPIGHLWAPTNSSNILNWLDNKSPGSVLYVAFGSIANFDKAQLEELANGLQMTARPFLWAIRPDLVLGHDEVFSSEFLSRVKDNALLVGWTPQQQVLAHPSIGCFITHCGWNSTLEGVRNGVRFLCWPFLSDNFLTRSYICDKWRIGLRVGPNDDGQGELEGSKVTIIKRENIKERVEEVMKDDEMKERALMWKERALNSLKVSGSSYEKYKRVVEIMKVSP